MNDALDEAVWNFLTTTGKGNAENDGRKINVLESEMEVESLPRFYNMASSVLTKPSLFQPNIFDARLKIGRAVYNSKNEPSKAAMDVIDKPVRTLFDKTIMPMDLTFVRETQLEQAVIVRVVTTKSRQSYQTLEIWDFTTDFIKSYPYPSDETTKKKGDDPNEGKAAQEFTYSISYSHSKLKLAVHVPTDDDYPRVNEFMNKIVEKLEVWKTEPMANVDLWKRFNRSNNLVKPLHYLQTLEGLKKNHYPKLCEMWKSVLPWSENDSKMNKDIYEDLAIAAYIHCASTFIANKYIGTHIKSFVDMGCGNGLLTHLLAQLGWDGCGVDCKRGKLWGPLSIGTMLSGKTKKKAQKKKEADEMDISRPTFFMELVIDPKVKQFGKDNTRLFIGNHPDQLTPWIPLIARQAQSNFIVIPCCPYEFDGSKFQNSTKMKKQKFENAQKKQEEDNNSGIKIRTDIFSEESEEETEDETPYEHENVAVGVPNSTYQKYLIYIEDIAVACGFTVIIDRLRIPSTRRVAIIGLFDPKKQKQSDQLIEQSSFWPKIQQGFNVFQPPKKQEVINCTQLPREEMEKIVFKIFKYLIAKGEAEGAYTGGQGYIVPYWNYGSPTPLTEIIYNVLTSSERKFFKLQAKGLQTLMRNHSHIFAMFDGEVCLRIPHWNDIDKLKNKSALQTKPCYFRENHPEDCPLSDKLCQFRHQRVSKCRKNVKEVKLAMANYDSTVKLALPVDSVEVGAKNEEENEGDLDLSLLTLV